MLKVFKAVCCFSLIDVQWITFSGMQTDKLSHEKLKSRARMQKGKDGTESRTQPFRGGIGGSYSFWGLTRVP